jgi:hypothetical protein
LNFGQKGFEFGQSHLFCAAEFGQSVFQTKIIQSGDDPGLLPGEKKPEKFCGMAQNLAGNRSSLLNANFWHI